jgi:hypothetical protein
MSGCLISNPDLYAKPAATAAEMSGRSLTIHKRRTSNRELDGCRGPFFCYAVRGGYKMSSQLEYQVALTKGGKFDAYKTSWLFADTSAEAIKRAKEWARSFDPLPKDAWLQVAMSGSDICNLRPGEF